MASGVLSRNSLEHAVAGSAATLLATLLLFPLERAKTLLQVDPAAYRGLAQALLRVLREEGPAGLFRGCAPTLQTTGASNFLYFFLFEGLKEPFASAFGRPDGEIGPHESLASSLVAGCLNMVVTEPLWRACVVAQSGKGRVTGVLQAVVSMWKAEGAAALWRGLGSSLWLVSNPVIQFFAYDILKAVCLARRSRARGDGDEVTTVEALVMGALAKALATVATFPLQVAQSRLRAAQGAVGSIANSGGTLASPELRGMLPCLRQLLREGGLRGMYQGLGPKLVQTVSLTAFMFAFYEKIHWVIRRAAKRSLRRSWQQAAVQSA